MTGERLLLTGKRLILHVGYHQTGAGLIRQWLEDHANILAPHLALYLPDDPLVEALRDAAMGCARGRADAEAALTQAARDLAEDIRNQGAPLVLLSDEALLGPPLGHVAHGHVETEIYPSLCPILNVLARELAGFVPTVAIFERDPDTWLENLHAQMVRQGAFVGDLDTYLSHYEPQVNWAGLRDEITFALQGRGRLTVWPFETEFPKGAVPRMGFFEALEIPDALMARCRPTLLVGPRTPPKAAEEPTDTPPLPRALQLGGANAMAAGGWGQLMRRDYSALVQAQTLSTAAGTSATALYRMLAEGSDTPGAAVIWEQGINEYTHLTGGQDLDSLLYHVEWLLQLCQRENRPFVPLLTRTKMQAAQGRDDPYVTGLRALFARYGLTVLDTDRLIEVLERGPADPARWYARNALYDPETDLPRRMAEAVLMALSDARVPVSPPDRAAHFDALVLRLRRPAGTPETFDLAGTPCPFAPFEDGLTLAAPGRALAAFLVTGGNGPVIRLEADQTDLGCYVTQVPHGPGQPPQQLRQLVLGHGAGGVEIPGGVVQIGIDTSPEAPIVQTMFHQGPPPSDPLPTGLVALLCEEPAGDAV